MKASRRRKGKVSAGSGYICNESPLCYALEVEYDQASIELDTIDLFDPVPAGGGNVWSTFKRPWSNEATQAALNALKRAAQGGVAVFDCDDDKCECRLTGQKSDWGKWKRMKISGRFSIPAPKPPPPRLRFRANGSVRARARWQVGVCYHIEL